MGLLQSNPAVAYVEPDYIVNGSSTPNDPNFPQQWSFNNTSTLGADIGALQAWDISSGSTANVVGVVDTGIDYTHPDLAANVWAAPTDFTVSLGWGSITCPAGSHGYNAINRSCDPRDDHYHGTHVSGTIGAAGNNAVGVAGVNWTTRIMGLKFLDSTGSGSTSNAIDAIEFAIQVKAKFAGGSTPVNVRVLSNSWGGDGFSQALLDEINKANTNEMLFVAAAGNSSANIDSAPQYPAAFNAPNLIAVAATGMDDSLASFSNWGQARVHLGAPGVNIISTIPGGGYTNLSGTSMATPHVAGAAMLLLSKCSLNTSDLRGALLANVDVIPSLAAKTVTGGRLNVNRAIRACAGIVTNPGSATFVGTDLTTKGNWKSVYGSHGYNVIQDTAAYPSSVTVSPGNVSSFTWTPSTTDVRGLQKASGTDRVAGCWYTNTSASFVVDFNFSDASIHQVALYFVDWDNYGRNLRVQVLNGNNVLLDSQTLATFVNGAYLVWKMTGHVKVQVTNVGGGNPVLSGIFFGAATGNSVTVSPTSVSLTGGQTQTFMAAVTGTSNQAVTWSLSAGAPGSISAGGTYTAPPTISNSQIVSVIATSAADGITAGSAQVSLVPAATGPISFVQTDLATKGNWKSAYGSQGYNVIQDTASYPSYVSVTPANLSSYTWVPSTTDVRGLQKAASATDRIAGCWYTNSSTSFMVDLNFSDSVLHQVAFYFVDWDSYGRNLRVQVLDAGNNVLDTQNLTSFVNGAYLVWKLTGHVKVQVTNLGGGNPVLSGIFFGAATGNSVTVAPSSVSLSAGQMQTFTAAVAGTSNQAVTWSLSSGAPGSISTGGVYAAPPTITSSQTFSVIATSQADGVTTGSASVILLAPASGTAAFVRTDLTTKGNWKSVYGGQGYGVIQDTVAYPSFAAVTPIGLSTWTWEASTTDVRALQKAASGTDRIAGCWYTNASTSFVVDLNFSDSAVHQMAFYFVDWDSYGRNLRVQVLDSSNNILDTQNLTSFVNGAYLVWNLTGHVKLQVTNLGGGNPVLSGIFFQ